MKGIGGFSTPTESYANRFPFLPYCWLTNNVGNMNELIKITEKDGKQVVSAKELYLGLGLDKSHWTRWSMQNIEEDKFFNENEDWVGFATMANGNETKDYAITLDFAKHLAMMARTEKSYEYPNYFLECERIAKSTIEKALPKTFAEALRLAAEQAEQIEKQQALIAEQTPKAEFFDAVADSKDAVPMLEVAKVLGIKGMGRNNLFEFLRQEKVLMNNNIPYQRYQDLGYFRVIEQKYTKNYEECINFKTLVYQKGVDFIRKLINNKYKENGK